MPQALDSKDSFHAGLHTLKTKLNYAIMRGLLDNVEEDQKCSVCSVGGIKDLFQVDCDNCPTAVEMSDEERREILDAIDKIN